MTLALESTSVVQDRAGSGSSVYGSAVDSGSQASSAILFVPSEEIFLTVIDLPLPTLRQRVAAAPFAVEDLIADPLSSVHIAVGAEISPKRHLVAVVRHDAMRRFIASSPSDAATNCPIVPDALALAVPTGGGWAVHNSGGRAIVRCADASGFAIETSLLSLAWNSAGQPAIAFSGEQLPADIQPASGEEVLFNSASQIALDLRQGQYASRASRLHPLAGLACVVVAAGVLAHTLIAGVDVMALNGIAETRERDARAALARISPGLSAESDVVEAMNRIADLGSIDGPVQFLPLMSRLSAALRPFGTRISFLNLAFARTQGTLAMTVEGPDLTTLQAVEQALREVGLNPQSGPATTLNGGAEFRITIQPEAIAP